jgi:hypothetical protein
MSLELPCVANTFAQKSTTFSSICGTSSYCSASCVVTVLGLTLITMIIHQALGTYIDTSSAGWAKGLEVLKWSGVAAGGALGLALISFCINKVLEANQKEERELGHKAKRYQKQNA